MPEKKERLKVCQLSLRHPALAQFRNRPFGFQTTILIAVTLLGFYMVATVPAIVYSAISNSPYKDGYAVALLFCCIALSLRIAYPLVVKLALKSMLAEMNEDEEIARKPEGSVFYVGIIYFDGIASFDEIDSAWDRGWLSIESGCLVYRGINSQFRLPLILVREVRSAITGVGGMTSSRVVVSWNDPDGIVEHLIIEIRDAVSRKDNIRRIELLEGWIGDAIRLHATDKEFDASQLPFRSTVAEQAKGYTAKVLRGEDYAIAFALSSAFFLPVAFLYSLGARAIGQSTLQSLFFLVALAPSSALTQFALGWHKAKRLREDA